MYDKQLLIFILAMMLSGIVYALPPKIEADRLLLAGKNAIAINQYSKAADYFSRLKQLDTPVPNEFFFHFGKVQIKNNNQKRGLLLLEKYFSNAKQSDENYEEGLRLYTEAELKTSVTKGRSSDLLTTLRQLEKQLITIPGQGYAIGKYEVTQRQWQSIMGYNPAHFTDCGLDCPVEQLSWYDVHDFITKLNQLSQYTYHLPTGVEWEIACLAGEETTYCGSDDASQVAGYDENSNDKTQPVGQKNANAWGLYDMTGNVWEWVNECYRRDCVLRGGSWLNDPIVARSAGNYWKKPAKRFNNVGFRLARSL